MVLIWNDTLYATGVTEVDDQHKRLFEIINELLEAGKSGESKESIAKIIDLLGTYVQTHFSCEERHMEQRNCSACAVNKEAHALFLELFTALRERFEREGPTDAFFMDVQTQLCHELTHHIRRIDLKLRETVTSALQP